MGIYQTGDAFEDSAVLLPIREAQELLGKSRQVSLFYIQLKDPSLKQRLVDRVERQWPKLKLTGASEYANKQAMVDMMRGMMWVISMLAIIIGGVSMMNSQLMSVFERTREIGVLRSLGWSSGRVLRMILSESLLVCLAGGLTRYSPGLRFIALSAIPNHHVRIGYLHGEASAAWASIGRSIGAGNYRWPLPCLEGIPIAACGSITL